MRVMIAAPSASFIGFVLICITSESLKMLKKLLILLSLLMMHACWAQDSYNPTNNQLTIPSVDVVGTTYNNVVITVGGVVRIDGGAPNGSSDVYNPATNQLSIPTVLVNGQTYTNVVVTVGQVVSVGAAPSDGGNNAGGTTNGSAGGSNSTNDASTTNASSVLVTTFIAIN